MIFNLGAPQVIYLVLIVISVTTSTVNHGKPREPYNGYIALAREVVLIMLLAWGGFFS
jgi:hypothetical protein